MDLRIAKDRALPSYASPLRALIFTYSSWNLLKPISVATFIELIWLSKTFNVGDSGKIES